MKPLEQELINSLKLLEKNNFITSDLDIDSINYPEVKVLGKKYVLFCSNNYLGLSNLKSLKKYAKKAIDRLGYSTSESRKLGGNLAVYEKLEHELANYKKKESGVVFATGLLANIATLSAIGGMHSILSDLYKVDVGAAPEEITIFSDRNNHRSIQMGIKLSGAKKITYDHLDFSDLSSKLRDSKSKLKLIVSDSIFSMHGEVAPLVDLAAIAEKHQAMLMIDDAHGTGVFGRKGRGLASELGVEDRVDISMGTLSKAFGGIGGFITTRKYLADYIKNVGSGYRFTSSLPPEQAYVALKTLEVIKKSDNKRKKIWENVNLIGEIIDNYGFISNPKKIHIIPIYCQSNEQAKRYEQILFKNSIIAPAVTAPVVEVTKPLIRLVVNSTHTKEHINMLEYALRKCKKSDGKLKRTA